MYVVIDYLCEYSGLEAVPYKEPYATLKGYLRGDAAGICLMCLRCVPVRDGIITQHLDTTWRRLQVGWWTR